MMSILYVFLFTKKDEMDTEYGHTLK